MRRPIRTVLGLLAGAACTPLLVGPDPTNAPGAIYDIVWQEFDRHYALFGLKTVAWDSLYGVHRAAAASASTEAELGAALWGLLAELQDLHVNLYAAPTLYRYNGYDARPHQFEPQVVFTQYVPQSTMTASTAMRYGRFRGAPTVGYVWIGAMTGGAGPEIDGVLTALSGVEALVVDVRDNPGGASETAERIAARFADCARTFAWARYRNGPRHEDLSNFNLIVLRPAGSRFAGPVAVLTNRFSASAAEHFVLAMRVLPGVTVIGDSTAGGSGNPVTRELPNGWTYQVPQAFQYTLERQPYEVVGLAPDIVVRRTTADSLAGLDRAVERALAILPGAVPPADSASRCAP